MHVSEVLIATIPLFTFMKLASFIKSEYYRVGDIRYRRKV